MNPTSTLKLTLLKFVTLKVSYKVSAGWRNRISWTPLSLFTLWLGIGDKNFVYATYRLVVIYNGKNTAHETLYRISGSKWVLTTKKATDRILYSDVRHGSLVVCRESWSPPTVNTINATITTGHQPINRITWNFHHLFGGARQLKVVGPLVR